MRFLLTSLTLFSCLFVTTGCNVPSDECKTFVACRAHYQGEFALPEMNVNRFKGEGVCWESQQLADDCTAECTSLTDGMRADLVDALKPTGPCGAAALVDGGS